MKSLFFVLMMVISFCSFTGCASMLHQSIVSQVPKDAQSFKLVKMGGRVEALVSYQDKAGNWHDIAMACAVVYEKGVEENAEPVTTYHCASGVDSFVFIDVQGEGKIVVVKGPLDIKIYDGNK